MGWGRINSKPYTNSWQLSRTCPVLMLLVLCMGWNFDAMRQISRDFGRDHADDAQILIYESQAACWCIKLVISCSESCVKDWLVWFSRICGSKSMSMREKTQDRRNIHEHNILACHTTVLNYIRVLRVVALSRNLEKSTYSGMKNTQIACWDISKTHAAWWWTRCEELDTPTCSLWSIADSIKTS